jgi:2-dehydropantoate 2-reductase
MRQDVEAGRATEIDRLHGAVVDRAEEAGIDVPVNRTLADLVRLAETGAGAEGSDP